MQHYSSRQNPFGNHCSRPVDYWRTALALADLNHVATRYHPLAFKPSAVRASSGLTNKAPRAST